MDTSSKRKILIVDDNEMNRIILTDMLEDDYDLYTAEDGQQAIALLEDKINEIDLMLLDIVMPVMDGFGVLEEMNRRGWMEDIQVIMISAETAPAFMHRAYEMGAVDFISRPFDQIIVHRRIVNTIRLFAKQKELMGMIDEQIRTRERDNRLMITILSHLVEFRNGESGPHVTHINVLTEFFFEKLFEITDKYDYLKKDLNLIRMASSLHDIGKISIPSEILNKPGRLTDEEFEIMKTHSAMGSDMMDKLTRYKDEPLVKYSREICRWHHEKWDGRGYPDHLAGDDIPITAQIVALSDVYDALTSERCYKPAYSHEKAVDMILNGECGTFNPMLMKILKDVSSYLPGELKKRYTAGDKLESDKKSVYNEIRKSYDN